MLSQSRSLSSIQFHGWSLPSLSSNALSNSKCNPSHLFRKLMFGFTYFFPSAASAAPQLWRFPEFRAWMIHPPLPEASFSLSRNYLNATAGSIVWKPSSWCSWWYFLRSCSLLSITEIFWIWSFLFCPGLFDGSKRSQLMRSDNFQQACASVFATCISSHGTDYSFFFLVVQVSCDSNIATGSVCWRNCCDDCRLSKIEYYCIKSMKMHEKGSNNKLR